MREISKGAVDEGHFPVVHRPRSLGGLNRPGESRVQLRVFRHEGVDALDVAQVNSVQTVDATKLDRHREPSLDAQVLDVVERRRFHEAGRRSAERCHELYFLILAQRLAMLMFAGQELQGAA